jgi:hypothetical protein
MFVHLHGYHRLEVVRSYLSLSSPEYRVLRASRGGYVEHNDCNAV